MESKHDSQVWQFKWHIVIVVGTMAGVIALALFTRVFEKTEAVQQLVWMLGGLIFLGALLVVLTRVVKIADTLRENSSKLEEATKALEDIHQGLAQIGRSTQISEAAKAIAFRDRDMQSLREAVLEKLRQRDFEGANDLIERISNHAEYGEIAEELKEEAERHRHSIQQGQIEQAISQIESLFDGAHWAKASVQIESLIKANPDSEKAKGMRQRLVERKEQLKRALLAQWDGAVKRQETDRSLEILQELDMYLTPNEALALQEAAKDVFRTKLHNLGVQFAIAVSDKHWTDALEIGQQIVRDFPNSRMSEEISGKLDVLRQNVQMQHT